MKHIFREYDIRGIFEKDLSEDAVKKIGYLLGLEMLKVGKSVGVGYDARVHSSIICKWLVSGLNRAGLEVICMNLVPTPCNYFAGFMSEGVSSTVMITGSHNPPEYNGLKITIDKKPFFGEQITALGEKVMECEERIEDDFRCVQEDVKSRYEDFLVEQFSHLKKMDKKIVIDCGNGAAGEVVEEVVRRLELNAHVMYATPDGTFPNHHPDPSEEENLHDVKEYLLGHNYDVAFAYDGDADRLAVLTQKHNFKGDQLAILYAKSLKNPRVLGEVKCSGVMYDEISKMGEVYMYKTGHSNIKMKMKELNIDVAVEVSGHIFFADRYFGYDDAIYAMLRTLELLQNGVDFDATIEALPQVFSTDELKVPTSEIGRASCRERV